MMIKKIIVILLLSSMATLLIAACGGTSSPGSGTSTPTIESTSGTSGSSTQVHMSYQSFAQSSVTIHKGSRITLVDDVAVPHSIANGSWDNSTAQPHKETNAPAVNVQLKGNDQQVIRPFTAAGTYHFYCTIHPGMNLTIIVQ